MQVFQEKCNVLNSQLANGGGYVFKMGLNITLRICIVEFE